VIRANPSSRRFLAVSISALLVYLAAVNALSGQRLSLRGPELMVRLPLAAQVVLAGGGPYLAAHLTGVRVLVADTFRMKPEEFEIQAMLQKDISWLNPAHEDNYYIAAAILSEPRLVPAAQYVLRRAADARPRDWTPLFYYAFNLYHFEKDPAAAARALLEGVGRTNDVAEQWGLQALAARWIERGYRTGEAARIVGRMAEEAPPGGFRRYMKKRTERLLQLDRLTALAQEYRTLRGHAPARIEDLVDAGLIDRIPVDPLGIGFAVDQSGEPVFRDSASTGVH
jgi:hypothetical protein